MNINPYCKYRKCLKCGHEPKQLPGPYCNKCGYPYKDVYNSEEEKKHEKNKRTVL